MSLILVILLIWATSLFFALLEGTLQKNKREKLARKIHLAVLCTAVLLVGIVFWEFVKVVQGFTR